MTPHGDVLIRQHKAKIQAHPELDHLVWDRNRVKSRIGAEQRRDQQVLRRAVLVCVAGAVQQREAVVVLTMQQPQLPGWRGHRYRRPDEVAQGRPQPRSPASWRQQPLLDEVGDSKVAVDGPAPPGAPARQAHDALPQEVREDLYPLGNEVPQLLQTR